MYVDALNFETFLEEYPEQASELISNINSNIKDIPLKNAVFIFNIDDTNTQLSLSIIKGDKTDILFHHENNVEIPEELLLAELKMIPRFIEERVNRQDYDMELSNAFTYDAGDKKISIKLEIDTDSFDGASSYQRILVGIGKCIEEVSIPVIGIYETNSQSIDLEDTSNQFDIDESDDPVIETHEDFDKKCKIIGSRIQKYVDSLSKKREPFDNEMKMTG